MRWKHPRIIASLATTILSLALIEIGLNVFDPWQVKAYFGDMAQFSRLVQPDATRGYVMPPGEYQFSSWSAVILADGTRAVPDTGAGTCSIAFLGDSVTFGHGVSDGDTWVNLLAARVPSIRLLNAGVNGYNAAQVWAARQAIRADGYLYLQTSNDADPPLRWVAQQAAAPVSAVYIAVMPTYIYVLDTRVFGHADGGQDYAMFDQALAQLRADARVLVIGFDNDPLAPRANVPQIAQWTHYNSFTDKHANADGNREIAAGVAPYLDTLVARVCRESVIQAARRP